MATEIVSAVGAIGSGPVEKIVIPMDGRAWGNDQLLSRKTWIGFSNT